MGSANKNAPFRSRVSRRELPSFTGAQRAAIYPAQRGAGLVPPVLFALPPLRAQRPRVNVYLCIKQALFIRPMNMHCLVAVARCRVQTRRYHCLINHTQSQRSTLRVPSSRALPPAWPPPCTPLSSPRRGLAVSSLRALHASPPAVFLSPSLSLVAPSASAVQPVPPHQPAAIDTNLRNFFGPSTCHRVTAHSRPGVPDLLRTAECSRGGVRRGAVRGRGHGPSEGRRAR